ncbi:hypothetical protein ACHQM5_019365 [Ranunculus cassubicifolius]
MEKVSVEMELDDWEYLPDSGYCDFNDHEHVGKFKFPKEDRKAVIRPFPSPRLIDVTSSMNPSVMSPVPVDLEPMVKKTRRQQELELELEKIPFIDIGVVVPTMNRDINRDQDTVSRVFFKKMKENEFVDMKMDSPRSKGLKLLTDQGSVQFEDKEEIYKGEIKVKNDKEIVKRKKGINWDGKLNIWGWKVNGVGALCCIGVAAATTVCIVIFGNRKGNKPNHNQKIQFQINSDDNKKVKPVVQQEHIFSQAISAAREIPINGAHIFFGDY